MAAVDSDLFRKMAHQAIGWPDISGTWLLMVWTRDTDHNDMNDGIESCRDGDGDVDVNGGDDGYHDVNSAHGRATFSQLLAFCPI